MRRPILNYLRGRELVYDPFLGSGTTLAAAQLTERVCYGLLTESKTRAGSPVTRNASPHPRDRAQRCAERSDEEGRFQDRRLSAPRSHGKRASSTTMLSAVVPRDAARGAMAGGGVTPSARRARWLRPYALPPRAPRRRSCSGDLLNKIYGYWVMVSPDTTFISSGGGDTASQKCGLGADFRDQKAMRASNEASGAKGAKSRPP